MTLIDGKMVASELRKEIRAEVAALNRENIRPCLAVVLVGDNPASRVYVSNKEKDCAECGLVSKEHKLSAETGEQELLALIAALNADESVHGIIVQLPLPKQIDEQRVIAAISPDKDVDCFHPYNVGCMMQGNDRFLPCTPAGVMALLDYYHIDPAGKHCVVLGRSNIVGKPQAMLLLRRNGTVTICHSKTPDLAAECRKADILVSAVGKVNLVTADMVKQGAVVIDVAMNRNEAGKLCGDVAFDAVAPQCSYITPVPGGVGPMTRLMLLRNTLTAAARKK
ncbi:MAG: bifunctional methylenetetrahydrofolate dehydrogenase/methenyltetrahydrofolate cyclohydrolase FolD [Oscillospiraceae bacterium]|nr:bifunctional methylenetetrahydrofolate dehydrogenase/methenyltetrahydrofolate cyclohydrolase FolD [Oscillospiraceae bacterium]